MSDLDHTLLQIYRLLLESEDVYALLPEILDLVIQGTKAERGQIELYDEKGEPRFLKARKGGKDVEDRRESKISSKILAWVKETNEIVLSANARKDERFRDSATVLGQNVLSVVCAPLRDEHGAFGVLYIDNRNRESLFNHETKDLLDELACRLAAPLRKKIEERDERKRMSRELQHLRDRELGYAEIIGNSPAIPKVLEEIEFMKDHDDNVLVLGESGTGKELVARLLHRKSGRAERPFVAFDDATVPEDILISTLFSHEKGAFTGAMQRRKGLVEEAEGGTLFLDEIGNLSARVGPYRLLEEIGKGGMGRVFLAERVDGEYEQRVALKLINKSEDEEELLPRFYQERQALAMLAHSNIARLLDGGVTDDDQPYLVMEYIAGLPLDVYCDQHQCDTQTRVRLFREVLAGVQHAHQHFLVHRDLKPGNILVTDEGVPKLLDFGIVKWLQASGRTPKLTVTGTQPMTLEYASPEQVKGEAVTTVSDVYTLGVLLYELLTGHSPYRKTTPGPYDLQKAICEQEPETPSAAINRIEPVPAPDQQTTKTLTPEVVSTTRESSPKKLRRRLAGDLDSIIAQSFAQRAAAPLQLGGTIFRGLGRYLEGQPVSAREATFTYRAAKFARLHKFGVGATVLVLLLSLGFGLAMALQVERTKRERDKAQQVSKFLADIFTASDPNHSN